MHIYFSTRVRQNVHISFIMTSSCRTENIGSIQKSLYSSFQQPSISSLGRARRDAASRAMQGWHSQHIFGNGDVGDHVVKVTSLYRYVKYDNHFLHS